MLVPGPRFALASITMAAQNLTLYSLHKHILIFSTHCICVFSSRLGL